MYERHEKPIAYRSRPSLSNPHSTNDIVRAVLRANPTLLRSATNRDPTIDGTDTEISSHLTYKWRVRINQAGLYNKKEGAPKGGLGKMAKNESLPAHLQEKYSRGDDRLNLV